MVERSYGPMVLVEVTIGGSVVNHQTETCQHEITMWIHGMPWHSMAIALGLNGNTNEYDGTMM